MASPTFNGQQIFDSIDGNSDSFSEGVLDMGDYSKLNQEIHVNGENGIRRISMGWGDRSWTFTGIISAPNTTTLLAILNTIQTYIDESGGSTYRTLVTSFGDSFTTNAQILHMHRTPIQFRIGGGYSGFMTHVTVTGICQGMQTDG